MERIKNTFLSDQNCLNSSSEIAWGPDNLLAVATENMVTIYRINSHDHKYEIFRKITKHKSNITSLSWNHPTIEIQNKNSFKIFLAVGDESGNVLVYDIFTLSRHAGISIERDSTNYSICDLKWKRDDASTLFVLTTQPVLFSIDVGSNENLNKSKMETFSINSAKFCAINLEVLWFTPLNQIYKYISIDLYDPNRLLLSSTKDFTYSNIKISKNGKNIALSNARQYPIDIEQKLLHIEYYPFRPNYLLLLTNKTLYLYNLRNTTATPIVHFDNFQPFCCINGIFSYSISDRFWLASIDGYIYRLSIDQDDEVWVVDSFMLASQRQLHLIVSDFLHPTRICALFNDGIRIIEELPINSDPKENTAQIHLKEAIVNLPENSKGSSNPKIIFNSFESEFDDDLKNHPLQLHRSQNFSNSTIFSPNQECQLFQAITIPNLLGEIKSWDASAGKIACLSTNGYLAIFSPRNTNETIFEYSNLNDICDRIKLKAEANSVYFYDDDSVIVTGSNLKIINFKNRNIQELSTKITSEFSLSGNVFGYLPSTNIIHISKINQLLTTKQFSSKISHFCISQTDNTKIALVISDALIIIGYPSTKQHELNVNQIGSIVQIAYSNEYVYLGTSKGLIVQINALTGDTYAYHFSTTSIRYISVYKSKYLCVCDMSNLCTVLLIGDGSFTVASTSPCYGKEIHVLNDAFCVVQTRPSSNPVITLYQFPSLESVKISYAADDKQIMTQNSNENAFKDKLLLAKTIDECKSVAKQIGDLLFVQFCQIVKHENNSILPSFYEISKEKYISNERCFCACNRQNPLSIDEYVEYLILTNQNEKAAEFVLKNVNTQNILLANACLSTSAEEEKSVKKIMKIVGQIDGNERIFALLLKIGNCIADYAKVASKIKDPFTSIKFLKMICSRADLREIIRRTESNYLLMAFFDEYFDTFEYLIKTNQYSKAYAYMQYFEEKRIVFDDPTSLIELKNKFNSTWYDSLQLDMFL